jgi:hypothetical protein
MAEFSIEEFQEYFREIASEFKINNVEAYLDSVTSDIDFYTQNKEEKTGGFLPEKYQDNMIEYFVLLHFSRYFLDGIRYTKQINLSFSKYDEIKKVVFFKREEEIDLIEIGKEKIIQLEKEYEDLRNLYIILGQSLMAEKFLITDFIK